MPNMTADNDARYADEPPAKPVGEGVQGARSSTHLVLVIANSSVNRVVVSRIVERAGLRAVSVTPDTAEEAILQYLPGTVILDGGADNRDCDGLFARLTNLRMVSERGLPQVIMLSTRNIGRDSLAHGHAIDAVVAKPITPDSLQPVLQGLVETIGG